MKKKSNSRKRGGGNSVFIDGKKYKMDCNFREVIDKQNSQYQQQQPGIYPKAQTQQQVDNNGSSNSGIKTAAALATGAVIGSAIANPTGTKQAANYVIDNARTTYDSVSNFDNNDLSQSYDSVSSGIGDFFSGGLKKKSNNGATKKTRTVGGATTYCCSKESASCVVPSMGFCANPNERKQKCTFIDEDTIKKTIKNFYGDLYTQEELNRIKATSAIPFYDTGKTNTDIANGLQYMQGDFYVCNDGKEPLQTAGVKKKQSKKRKSSKRRKTTKKN